MGFLGLDWKILIGQVINFAILLYLLKRFAYKPLLHLLEKRKKEIAEGLEKSREAENFLQQIRTVEQRIKEKAEIEKREIIKRAELQAQSRGEDILLSAEKQKQNIIKKAREMAEEEIEREKEINKKEAIEIAFLTAQKFLKEKINQEDDKKFIEKLIAKTK